MRTDKKIIDAQLSAIETIKSEFLKFANYSEMPSQEELKARHERINEALANCGGSLDGYWVLWLFGELEQRAAEELRKVTLLAQTTDPEALKDKYFNDLPEQLIDNVKTLAKYYRAHSSREANAVKDSKKNLRDCEIIRRAKWFLNNPEPEYRDKVDRYRSNTLAECIKNNWFERRRPDPTEIGFTIKEDWENCAYYPEAPSQEIIKKAIRTGVKSKDLPEFLLGHKPKK
jgi:hypothetical protein